MRGRMGAPLEDVAANDLRDGERGGASASR
jgi:hypothetical protein